MLLQPQPAVKQGVTEAVAAYCILLRRSRQCKFADLNCGGPREHCKRLWRRHGWETQGQRQWWACDAAEAAIAMQSSRRSQY